MRVSQLWRPGSFFFCGTGQHKRKKNSTALLSRRTHLEHFLAAAWASERQGEAARSVSKVTTGKYDNLRYNPFSVSLKSLASNFTAMHCRSPSLQHGKCEQQNWFCFHRKGRTIKQNEIFLSIIWLYSYLAYSVSQESIKCCRFFGCAPDSQSFSLWGFNCGLTAIALSRVKQLAPIAGGCCLLKIELYLFSVLKGCSWGSEQLWNWVCK